LRSDEIAQMKFTGVAGGNLFASCIRSCPQQGKEFSDCMVGADGSLKPMKSILWPLLLRKASMIPKNPDRFLYGAAWPGRDSADAQIRSAAGLEQAQTSQIRRQLTGYHQGNLAHQLLLMSGSVPHL
jgi:hypothetical protein